MSILVLVFVLFGAFLFAKLEIEIEGKNGWAAGLPTWRVEGHKLLDLFFGGRPLTGYHVWAFFLILFLMHQPFFWGLPFSWRGEARIIGAYFIFWIAEDILWFALNPHYGFKRFTREHVWWHKRWVLGVPVDYWLFGSAAFLLIAWS